MTMDTGSLPSHRGRARMPGTYEIIDTRGRHRTNMHTNLVLLSLVLSSTLAGGDAPPEWAYPVNPANLTLPADDGTPLHVPDSEAAFTLTEIRDLNFSPDWHPGDHPPMPEVVARGRKPAVLACGCCHRADGSGGPENARLAGLPAAYIAQQMADFKSGARKTSVPGRNPGLMVDTARAITNGEIEAAAAYFSALMPRSAIKIVEAVNAPKSRVVDWHLAVASTPGKEPLGRRIIEVPENLEQFERRDGRSRWVAYVPPGSVQRGEKLVTSGGGRTVPCGFCHGPDLKGLGTIPGIAGRSPSYFIRQLYDFSAGVRGGAGSVLMKPVVAKLALDDMISLAAYAASLNP
jgi:cytochrome c553